MFSYWEQQSFCRYDHIVIGAGIVGLSVAIELRQRFPASRILVLERGMMSTGASSRNAGFACMGSVSELLDDLEHTAEEEVIRLFADRKKGLELLRRRLGDQAIGYEARGSYELISTDPEPVMTQLDRLNRMLLPVTGTPAFSRADEQIGTFGFDPLFTRALIRNNGEGALHTGKMLRALNDLATGSGIEIKTGARVSQFREDTDGVYVSVPDDYRGDEWQLYCRNLAICTNAFTAQLLPDEDVTPGRGQVLITEPVAGLKFKGIFHFEEGYYYFRELDGRVLFGGGRNLDVATETTTDLALNDRIQEQLDTYLARVILPGIPFRVAQRWSGIMAFGKTKTPIVRAFSERIYGAFRMGGMGVALGSEVAARLVREIMTG